MPLPRLLAGQDFRILVTAVYFCVMALRVSWVCSRCHSLIFRSSMRSWIDILLFKYSECYGSSYISLLSSYLYLCIYQYLITTPSCYYARQLVVTWKLVSLYVLTFPKIQCLAKVFGPLELCDLLPHFRLQT